MSCGFDKRYGCDNLVAPFMIGKVKNFNADIRRCTQMGVPSSLQHCVLLWVGKAGAWCVCNERAGSAQYGGKTDAPGVKSTH
jgi:hypothetical protein